MSRLTRNEAHLMVAAIRVLDHQEQRPPTPLEIADLLERSESAVRLDLNTLADLGIVLLVESAYEYHVEVKNYLLVEELDLEAGPQISDDLAAFDREKEEEAERMANLFESGEHDKIRRDKHDRMDQELNDFKKKKPINPFGED